jgi:threonine/homoserine/homoserine lactone efflux protein
MLVLGLLVLVLAASFMLAGIELTLAIAGVVVVLGGAAAFHYMVWGWWLSHFLRDEGEQEDRTSDGDHVG